MSIITLGKPEPILTTQTQYQNIWYDNDYDHYILPIERIALAQLVNLNAQHGGVLYARQNMILADFIDGGLTHEDLKASIMNYLIFGDTAILKVRNYWGKWLNYAYYLLYLCDAVKMIVLLFYKKVNR